MSLSYAEAELLARGRALRASVRTLGALAALILASAVAAVMPLPAVGLEGGFLAETLTAPDRTLDPTADSAEFEKEIKAWAAAPPDWITWGLIAIINGAQIVVGGAALFQIASVVLLAMWFHSLAKHRATLGAPGLPPDAAALSLCVPGAALVLPQWTFIRTWRAVSADPPPRAYRVWAIAWPVSIILSLIAWLALAGTFLGPYEPMSFSDYVWCFLGGVGPSASVAVIATVVACFSFSAVLSRFNKVLESR